MVDVERLFMLDVRGGGGGGAKGYDEDGVVEKRVVMHSWMCVSRVLSPGGSSAPQTGHSSSSRTSLLGLGCGGAEGGAARGWREVLNGGTGGRGALMLLCVWRWLVGRTDGGGGGAGGKRLYGSRRTKPDV